MNKRSDTATVDLKVRMKEPLRAAIESAAQEKRVSMNAEAVARLEQSFRTQELLPEALELAFGAEIGAVLLMIGRAISRSGVSAGMISNPASVTAAGSWLDDPYAYESARKNVDRILDALEPEGEPTVPTVLDSHLPKESGEISNYSLSDIMRVGFANAELHAAIGRASTSRGEREGKQVAEMLGPLVDRIRGRC